MLCEKCIKSGECDIFQRSRRKNKKRHDLEAEYIITRCLLFEINPASSSDIKKRRIATARLSVIFIALIVVLVILFH
ncbi:MAG: hypothetical protein GY749_46525 [Desulfobacteraceae bacterium]|nr:hypothetical protein [Desulfobacteraceae bacterium]